MYIRGIHGAYIPYMYILIIRGLYTVAIAPIDKGFIYAVYMVYVYVLLYYLYMCYVALYDVCM